MNMASWELKRKSIGKLNDANIANLSDVAGVFIIRRSSDKKIVYIGKGVEINNGGLRKRLKDFYRQSDSARNHPGGENIHDNLEDVYAEVIETGSDEEAVKTADELKKAMIKRYNPIWNFQK